MKTETTLPFRARLLQLCFTHLPIPGRYLANTLKFAGVDLAQLPSPIWYRDRWNKFSVEIRTPTDIIQRHILFQGYFEYLESLFVLRTLKPGNVFIDVGANIGWHSLLAADRVGKQGRVYSFEPATEAYEHLVRNILVNQFSQAEAFHYGLSNQEAIFGIYPVEEENSGANSLFGNTDGAFPIEHVKVRPGDNVLEELKVSTINLLKVDVEGAEVDVLEGLSDAFRSKKIRAIMIEVNPTSLARAGRSPDELIVLLISYGFNLREIRSGRQVHRYSDLAGGLNIIGHLN